MLAESGDIDVCFLSDFESIQYQNTIGSLGETAMVEVNHNVTFKCIGQRYPNIGNQWWLRLDINCIAPDTWDIVLTELQCNGIL